MPYIQNCIKLYSSSFKESPSNRLLRVLLPKAEARTLGSAKIFRCLTPKTFSGTGISDCLLWPWSRWQEVLNQLQISNMRHPSDSFMANKLSAPSLSHFTKLLSHYLRIHVNVNAKCKKKVISNTFGGLCASFPQISN